MPRTTTVKLERRLGVSPNLVRWKRIVRIPSTACLFIQLSTIILIFYANVKRFFIFLHLMFQYRVEYNQVFQIEFQHQHDPLPILTYYARQFYWNPNQVL